MLYSSAFPIHIAIIFSSLWILYHNIGKISMLVTNCQPDFADKTRLVVKMTNL